MSIALGLPLRDLFALVLGKSDLKSMFCLIVFSIVVLILAYLTNPTENSFRSYLTEQSFRHHLSRLDDTAEDNSLRIDHIRSLTPPKNKPATPVSSSIFAPENWPSFHFANRASISLRTPKHVFHSFGIFTIAAMLPTTKPSDRGSRDACMISDSWYVGAFGRWWRGGFFEEWYQDVITGLKDEESWTSGILNMKRLDMLQDFKVPTFSANNLPAHLAPGSPPRLRNREGSAQRNDAIRRQSTTPPPLPKSASLPMHTVRSGSRVYDSARLRQQHNPINLESATRVSAPPSRSPSTSLEQAPVIAEVLRQIAGAKTSVAELRAQLTECQTSASQSKSVLQTEVEVHRGKKRGDDASKVELKTRTKNLEDSKRNAEGLKKEADKKLKVAQTTRDGLARRMEFLDTGVSQLQEQVAQDLEFISSLKDQVAEEERIIPCSIERKRQEIRLAEDQVHTLNQRSKDLEERLSSRGEKLRILREKIGQYNERRSVANCDQQQQFHHRDLWLVGIDDVRQPLSLSPLSPVQHNDQVWSMQLDSSGSQNPASSNLFVEEHITPLNPKGFSQFSDSSLFNGYGNDMRHTSRMAPGFFTQEFVPIGLGNAFEEDNKISRSFKSDSDPHLDTNCWPLPHSNGRLDGSPLTTSSASTDDIHVSPSGRPEYSNGPHTSPARRISSTDKTRFRGSSLSSKGLNPDAKEFNFAPSSNSFNSSSAIHNSSTARRASPTRYDALNPSGIPSLTTTTQQSLLRAFALSPAERDALQRTLGVLSNKSFERLPSLSDVGSIPSSPTNNGHGPPSLATSSAGDFGSRLPAWLQSLPRNRKVNFSPWDDEEPRGVNDSN